MYVHNRFKFRLSGPPMRDIESIFLFSIYIRGDPASATVPGSTINSFISRWPRIRIGSSSWLPSHEQGFPSSSHRTAMDGATR